LYRRDPTPLGQEIEIHNHTFAKDISVRLATTAITTLNSHLSQIQPVRNHQIVGFMITSLMIYATTREIDFHGFDMGLKSKEGKLIPTTEQGMALPVISLRLSANYGICMRFRILVQAMC
jgi:predicted amino acid racemase